MQAALALHSSGCCISSPRRLDLQTITEPVRLTAATLPLVRGRVIKNGLRREAVFHVRRSTLPQAVEVAVSVDRFDFIAFEQGKDRLRGVAGL